MGDISHHISREEIACPCGCGFQTADSELVYTLEEACIHFLYKNPTAVRISLHINSWCRCAEYDLEVQKRYKPENWRPSGKPSEHLKGWATDFYLECVYKDASRIKIPDTEIVEYLEKTVPNRCGIGQYDNRTHLDMRPYKARWKG